MKNIFLIISVIASLANTVLYSGTKEIKINNQDYIIKIDPKEFFEKNPIKKNSWVDMHIYYNDVKVGQANYSITEELISKIHSNNVISLDFNSFQHTNLFDVVGNAKRIIELDIFEIVLNFREKRIGRDFLLYTLFLLKDKYPGATVILKAIPYGNVPTKLNQLMEHYGKCGFKELILKNNNPFPGVPHLYLNLDNTLHQSSAVNFSKFRLNKAVGLDLNINYLEN